MNYIALDYGDLALAASLILIQAVLSIALRSISFATSWSRRCAWSCSSSLVGVVLEFLFRVVSPWWTGLAVLIMIGFAGREAVARQSRKLAGLWGYGIGTAAMLMAATLVTVLALTTAIQPTPWYDPRYAIPLLGMVLGNNLTGVGARPQHA